MTAMQFLLDWAARSSVLIAIGSLLVFALRVKDPSVKLAAWTAMLMASLCSPLLRVTLPPLPLHLVPKGPALVVNAESENHLAPMTVSVTANSPRVASASPSRDGERVLFIAYVTGAGILLLRLFVGLVLAQRLVRRSRRTELSCDGVVILESAALTAPATLGLTSPVVILPVGWQEWHEAKLRAVLAHELSHVRRRDAALQALAAFHRALLWYSPLSWILHRQLVHLAEEASDQEAIAATEDRVSYAEVLLSFMQRGVRREYWHGAAMARYGRPEARINRILDNARFTRRSARWAAAIVLIVAAPVACLVAAVQRESVEASVPSPAAPTAVVTKVAAPAVQTVVASAEQPAPAKSQAASEAATTPVAPPAKQNVASGAAPEAAPAKPSDSATVTTQTSISSGSTGRIQRYIVVDDDSMSGSWNSDDTDIEALRSKYGRHFAWLRTDGKEYLITDAGVLEQFRQANGPQKEVNRMQADVNAHQADVNKMQNNVNALQGKVNELQHGVNARQEIVNKLQASVNRGSNEEMIQKLEQAVRDLKSGQAGVSQEMVNSEQAKVNEAQHGVNDKQAEVNQLQQKVNEQQQRVNEEYRRRMKEIFDSALSRGLAKPLN